MPKPKPELKPPDTWALNLARSKSITIPTILIPLPDGSYQAKPGKPVLDPPTISTRRAAVILDCSQRRVQELCDAGKLPFRRNGPGPTRYHIPLQAVLALRDSHTHPGPL